MKIVAIIQARVDSIRLPNKVMKLVNETPIIELLIKRLNKSKQINKIIVATSEKQTNKKLLNYVKKLGFSCDTGDEDDVLARYFHISKKHNADVIVRITGDCPLIDASLVDKIIEKFKEKKIDYVSNTILPTYPDGLDTEVFTFSSLERAYNETHTKHDREHVTPYLKKSNFFNKYNFKNNEDFSHLRLTVDNAEDLKTIKKIFEYFSPNIYFSWIDVLNLYKKKPDIFTNLDIKRNEGEFMSKGQKLWQRAKRSISGGNMLLSKRPEMFLPEKWPTYFSKTKGCKVWDLDGREYFDMSMMGIGTNILGYSNHEVDEAVIKNLQLISIIII